MRKLFSLLGSVIGGYAGWALGDPFGLFTMFLLSMAGTGVGIDVGRRIGTHYEGG
jgi:hypothetical protein